MYMDWIEIILVFGFVALGAYDYGVNKPKRDRYKRQAAEYEAALREGRPSRYVP